MPMTSTEHAGGDVVTSPEWETPGGCEWCGHAQRNHASRWGTGVGFHQYVAPSQRTIKRRMQKRRACRG